MEGFWIVAVVAVTVVAPIAIIMHYITEWRKMRTLSSDDERLLEDLWQTANGLEGRVRSLETILDKEAPNWRERNG
jgi:phage shock protein B